MSIFRLSLVFVLGAALTVPTVFASRVHRAPTSGQTHKSRRPAHNKAHKMHGQQVIAPERATQIQMALIQKGYLSGEPTGTWDASSIAAMQKLQSDNGWQTKLTPDSRALIKLGLGPQATPAPSTTPQP